MQKILDMEQTIINQNPHWTGKKYPNLQPRTVFESLRTNLQTKHIQVLTGIRRSGKSSLFAMLINELMKDHKPKSILKLNMDNPLFFEIWDNPALIYALIETAEKITGEKIKYLFLDEVQVIKDWETFVLAQKEADLNALIKEERLKIEETRRFIENVFHDGMFKTTGIDIDKILPPVSRFSKASNRTITKQRVIDKMQSFFEKYRGLQ